MGGNLIFAFGQRREVGTKEKIYKLGKENAIINQRTRAIEDRTTPPDG